MTVFTEKEIERILKKDPFEGDTDSGFRYLKNKMGTVRKECQCRNCLDKINPGDTARIMSCAFNDGGEIVHGKYCVKCCAAIIKDNDGEAFANRFKTHALSDIKQEGR